MSAALDVRGLRYAYPDGREALRGVDLAVGPGERVAVLGPNGAGKTTLVLHLNGILEPRSGEVEIGGLPVTKANLAAIRQRVAIVFQDPDDQLFMPTVRDDVAFGPANAGLRGEALDARVGAALAGVDMAEHADRAPHHLSFGQRRRVAVATVLATILEGLHLTILVVTHDLPYALELCDRSVILDGGRIVADGPTHEILGDDALLAAHRLELPRGFQIHTHLHRHGAVAHAHPHGHEPGTEDLHDHEA
jgi:cobalt/nickel transport system ATP-binding protein